MDTEPDGCYPPQGNVTHHIMDVRGTSEIMAEISCKLRVSFSGPSNTSQSCALQFNTQLL